MREESDPSCEYVIASYRDESKNFRTRLGRIIRRAGLEPWPKLFQNLRSTRQTELCETFPAHVVCEWIGNSEAVAAKHYLQVTEEHMRTANGSTAQNLVANMSQNVAAEGCTELHDEKGGTRRKPFACNGKRLSARGCRKPGMGDEGLEQRSKHRRFRPTARRAANALQLDWLSRVGKATDSFQHTA